uniref:Uncharacterized protein n=1 Tax=Anguilla anguilla TaxID=7936 RepID=A0A0E9XFW5_ANGAN
MYRGCVGRGVYKIKALKTFTDGLRKHLKYTFILSQLIRAASVIFLNIHQRFCSCYK